MIRHEISPTELRRRINQADNTWYADARALTSSLPASPKSKDFTSLWGRIKPVYMTLQGSKCMYCEMQIEGRISNDVEHFRPKAKVAAWKLPKWLSDKGLVITAHSTDRGDPGYKNISYDPWNYGASCKPCNSVLKKNNFPISGVRSSTARSPRRMGSERALFIYPIGDCDHSPEELIGFRGLNPEPLSPKGTHAYFRALVTIETFKLNDGDEREELFSARARLMRELYNELEILRTSRSATDRGKAQKWVDELLHPRTPHTNCLRCFYKNYNADRPTAQGFIDDALDFLSSRSSR